MSSNGCVLGFNSSSAICATVGTVLVGAGGGVVLRRGNNSSQWVPGDGRYLIDKLVYSTVSHLLCVTEKRLDVVLHVFKYPGFSSIQKVENFARVEVQDMLFSTNGQVLAALMRMPSNVVKLFTLQRGRTLEKCATVELTEKFWKCLVFPPQRTDCVAVLDSREVAIVSQLLSPSSSPNVFGLSSYDNKFYSCCWSTVGVLCGAENGRIVLYGELNTNMQSFLECPTSSAITSLLQTSTLLLAGAEDGSVFGCDLVEKQLKLLLCVKSPIERMLLSGSGTDVVLVSNVSITMLNLDSKESSIVRVRGFGNTVKVLVIGTLVIWVSVNGDLMQYNKEKNTVLYIAFGFTETAVDACVVSSAVVVIYNSGCVRCFTVADEFKLSSHIKLCNVPLTVCVSDEASSVVVSGNGAIYFLIVQDGILFSSCVLDIFTHSITCLRWVGGQNSLILTACSNGEMQLVRFSQNENTFSGFLVVESNWRLDYPVHDFLPLYVDDDVINILVHSFDRDTKLYVLERRKDRDIKPLRPLFLMRDHEGGGGFVLYRLGESIILSGGSDGKVVFRDISHYLVKLTPIPPSKEKRRPQSEYMLRPFGKGGITFLSAWGDAGGFVCGGDDTVIHLISSGNPICYSWTEPVWHEVKQSDLTDTAESSAEKDDVMIADSKNQVISALAELRVVVDALLKERSSAIRVDDFLLPCQKAAFDLSCEMAISKAKDDDYYSMLYNEFVQNIIKRECWETMDVLRAKVIGLNDPKLAVYNFHCSKKKPENTRILQKLKFLRVLQIKVGDFLTFSSVVKRPGNYSSLKRTGGDASDDISELFYDPLDVYTNSRAIIQINLLCEKISRVKMAFNICFNALYERKKRETRRIEERYCRCKRIMRQLGEEILPVDAFFMPVVDVEEDPKAVFEVFDSELDPELLKLAEKTGDADFVISQSDEAALNTWMDGLEKDTEVLVVNVALPAFADESLEQFVAPDERTEEQQKAYEEYKKELAEKTAYVNGRKEALREEMKELVKANQAAAKKIDEEILLLKKQRMDVFELIDELECNQVNALRRLFIPTKIRNELLGITGEKKRLQGRLKQLQGLEAYQQGLLTVGEANLKKSVDKEKGLVAKIMTVPPFNDSSWGDKLHRRFVRWYAKYEEGTAKVPLVEQHDAVPVLLWENYCEYCLTIANAKEVVARNASSVDALTNKLVAVETEITKLQKEIAEKEAMESLFMQGIISQLINVQNLYRLRQGQVQDEFAKLNKDFVNFSFRCVGDVLNYNTLIFSSFDEISKLMGRISQKRQAMKMSAWEAERLQYSIGTLEMELRQLQTLRVTRQMQESIHTGAVVSHESEVNRLNRQIDYVRQVMSKKVEERNGVIARLNVQIKDKNIENFHLDEQVRRTKSIVDDKKAVWGMLGKHSDEEKHLQTRMRELYENSELEELARCQQEELFRLKCEVNRLRERTFPSFAVVSKKTVR